MSFAAAFVGMTATRIMAKRMTIAVREEMPMSATFVRVEIRTFQSISIGTVITAQTQGLANSVIMKVNKRRMQ
jgi:hypothetical protein